MDLKLLEDALALLEEKTLSRAAARRNVTQPAFSRRIRALEDWAGVPLLERRANSVVLRASLTENEAEIRTLLKRLSRLRGQIIAQGGRPQTVVLATQHALATDVFASLLDRFQDSSPDLALRLRTMNREDCISLFLHGEADLLLCYEARDFPPLPFDASIERRIWMRDTLIPVVGGSLRYRIDGDGGTGKALPLVGYPQSSHFGRLIERTGLNEPFVQEGGWVRVESAFTLGVLELIRSGVGLGWIPQSMCRRDLAAGNLVSLAGRHGSIPLDISLFAPNDNQPALDLVDDI
ncbi:MULTISPECIES: LysR family transcriptional regulator [unclassified Aurantimonas]|uniref:LysR family transcriptional regulator n=1 Tax=unclassified Aurantimonas TaxID=2638230 RepID=UPI002E182F38|nr:LysR family transcriptional regulator [Aurantimonas sp. A3-2-R12]